MGNLLVAPITDKETHRGVTDVGLEYAVSSMQGWRVHMEDAHITEGVLYAEELAEENDKNSANNTNTSTDNDTDDKGSKDDMSDGDGSAVKKAKTSEDGHATSGSSPKYNRIKLPGHSLFAVFDGHGGTFAAEFAGLNFTRVLCRQKAFVQYAQFINSLAARDAMETVSEDEVKMTAQEKAQVNREGLEFLETALRDAFLDVDRELWREVSGFGNAHSVVPPRKQAQEKDGGDGDNHEEHETGSGFESSGEEWQSGTTATVVMLTPQWILCANAGDSRSVYSKQGHCTIPLSYDHKPDDEAEERRIYDAGGCVRAGRVEGDLAVSRGLGDFRFKEDDLYQSMGTAHVSFSQYDDVSGRKKKDNASNIMSPGDQKVSPMPDIIVQNRSAEHDEFVVVACDGIFDVQTNHECIALTAEIFREGESDCGLVCEEVLDVCLEKGSKDNMTALIIKMPAQAIGQGGGVAERRRLRLEAEEKEKAS